MMLIDICSEALTEADRRLLHTATATVAAQLLEWINDIAPDFIIDLTAATSADGGSSGAIVNVTTFGEASQARYTHHHLIAP